MHQCIVGIHDANTKLSQLVQRATGETILTASHGKPKAKLVAINTPTRMKRRVGMLKGKLCVPGDFDVELPNEVLNRWAGKL